MTDALLTILESFGYPVFLHGTLNAGDPFPDSFFTFWNPTNPEGADYSNTPHWAVYTYNVWFYSSDRATAETVIGQAFDALRADDWTLDGRPRDAVSGVETHTGLMFTVKKLVNYE